MTVNYKLDSVIELRKYLWDQLVDAEIFNPDDYYSENIGDAIIPIIPVQQSPEMNQFLSGKTHIVYDKIGSTYEDNWMICCEKISFTIYSVDFAEINIIRNMMVDVFRRMDDSAKDLNRSRSTDKLIFHNTLILEMSPTEPSTELAGFLAADVILEVKYSRTVGQNGRFD
jgi:hypothetical protein